MSASLYAVAMREFRAAGMSGAEIARQFNVSPRTMQRWLRSAGAGRLSEQDRLRLITAAHDRRHEGMSLRQVAAWLAEQGYPRSVGWVHGALADYRCNQCSEAPSVASEHAVGGGPR
jgi:hypothetical protein